MLVPVVSTTARPSGRLTRNLPRGHRSLILQIPKADLQQSRNHGENERIVNFSWNQWAGTEVGVISKNAMNARITRVCFAVDRLVLLKFVSRISQGPRKRTHLRDDFRSFLQTGRCHEVPNSIAKTMWKPNDFTDILNCNQKESGLCMASCIITLRHLDGPNWHESIVCSSLHISPSSCPYDLTGIREGHTICSDPHT